MDNKNICFVYYSKSDVIFRHVYRDKIYGFLYSLTRDYPLFSKWYYGLFEGEQLKRDREIIVAFWGQEMVGISILKNGSEEKKLCTLKVAKRFRNVGIGKLLMEQSFAYLETDEPFFTVSRGNQAQFEKLFQYYGFGPAEERKNYYHLFRTEMVFHGELPCRNFWINKLQIISMEKFFQERIRACQPIERQDIMRYVIQEYL